MTQANIELLDALRDAGAADDKARAAAQSVAAVGDVATKEDISAVRTEMATKEDISAVRTEMTAVRTEMTAMRTEMTTMRTEITTMRTEMTTMRAEMATMEDISAVRAEMATKEDISALRAEMTADMATMEVRLIRWMVGMILPQYALLTVIALRLPW